MVPLTKAYQINWIRTGPLLQPHEFQWTNYPDLSLGVNGIDTKDPCPVYDDYGQLHVYGSVGRDTLHWWILHAKYSKGRWIEEPAVKLHGIKGSSIAAPGMMYENGIFHMFIQTDCFALGGNIEHLISTDGENFRYFDTVRSAVENTKEAGIYDPHPAIINGQKYIVYSAMAEKGRPDSINLLFSKNNTWYGPWECSGELLKQCDVSWHHNQPNQQDYEWGIEGAQLIPLPNGLILMNAVCFLPNGTRGTRQRTFFAVAENIKGPYYSLGPMMSPTHGWEAGENGHAAAVIENDTFKLFYQARESGESTHPWRYGLATCSVFELQEAAKNCLEKKYFEKTLFS
ncbi:MAG TPA: hypothetical protein VK338_01925 [Candidatus Nitrosocosmicus sp.]|nr:hypothetical protein [Candidatus Nitrosocosmicus sp.]